MHGTKGTRSASSARTAAVVLGLATSLAAAACRDTASVSEPTSLPGAVGDRSASAGPGEFPILVSAQTDNAFVAASDGGHFLVATAHYDNPTGISTPGALLLGPSGKVGPSLVFTSNAGGVGQQAGDVPSVAFDGSRYLVVYQANDSLDVRGQFVDRSGAAAGPSFLITSTAQQAANGVRVEGIAYATGTYLVSYERPATADDPDAPLGAFARTVSTSGAVGAELEIAVPSIQASVASDGMNFIAVYVAGMGPGRRAEARFISRAGVLGQTVGLSAPGSPLHQPGAVGFDGTNYLAVWPYQVTPGAPQIAFAVQAIGTDGTLAGTVASVALAEGTGKVCAVTSGETGTFLMSYAEGTPQRSTGQLFAPNGAPLGGPITIAAPDASTAATFACSLSAHGNRYLNLIMRKGSAAGSFYSLYGSFTTDQPGGAP